MKIEISQLAGLYWIQQMCNRGQEQKPMQGPIYVQLTFDAWNWIAYHGTGMH